MSAGEPPGAGAPAGAFLTVAQVTQRLSCSRSTLYRRFADGDLVRVRVGGRVRVPVWSVEQFERKQAEVQATEHAGMTYHELAARWGVSRRTLQRLVAEGVLVRSLPDPDDGRVRVPNASVHAFEAAQGGLDQAGSAALTWVTSGGV